MKKTLLALGLAAVLADTASATTLFFDDFEGTLSQWTGVYSYLPPTSAIVADPLQGDHALRAGLNSGGDIRTINPITSASGNYVVSFDYLGKALPGSVPGDFGGFVFWTGTGTWIGGSSASSGYPNNLIDDGAWHTYSFNLASAPGNSIFIEDWVGSFGVAGDAFFDNVRVTDEFGPTAGAVPEPTTLALFGLGLLALVAAAGRRSAQRA
jgi:hypothetical protein